MREQIAMGIVGCGYWGPNLLRTFSSLPDCNVGYMCDKDKKRMKNLQVAYPHLLPQTELKHMLNGANLDALAIATPVNMHHEMGMRCLEAGKHTFLEKPMARSTHECHELIECANSKGLSLMVGHTFLYSPAVRMIKHIIDSGEIGRIRHISSRRLNLGIFHNDINVVWDLAPHDISIIQYLMGEMPCWVNCQGQSNITEGVEDVAQTTLTFPSGVFATIHNSWLDPVKVRDMTIVGEKKMIVYDDVETTQKVKIYDQYVDRPCETGAPCACSERCECHFGDVRIPHIDTAEPLMVECQHFVNCIRNGEEPITCGQRGLELVSILEATTESLNHGGDRIPVRCSN